MANYDDVAEASCRILGVLGSIPEYETEEYRIFMNWVNSVKENLSYLHVVVENFQKHGGSPARRSFAFRFKIHKSKCSKCCAIALYTQQYFREKQK